MSKFLSSLQRGLLKPPYRLLPLAGFTYVVLSFLLHPLSPWRSGTLVDPDDTMRLVQVINWLQRQSWYDLSQPRLSPGAGTVVHWARLLDVPLALAMLPFRSWLGLQNAAVIAACIVPLFWLALMMMLVTALARRLAGVRHAQLASLLLLFAPLTLSVASPGRAGHHAPQVLVAGFGLLCLDRITARADGWRWGLAAALAFACGQWMGTEGLPWLLLFIGALTSTAAWQGGVAQRNAAVFGGGLALASLLVLPLALPVSDWDSRALSWFSPASVVLSVLAAAVLILGWLGGRLTDKRGLRLALVAALTVSAASLFAALVPAMFRGVFADYNPFDSGIALANITEAQPLLKSLRIIPGNRFTYGPALINFTRALLPSLAALAVCVFNLRRATTSRFVWAGHALFLSAALLLTLFWQVRVGWFMQFFAIAPLCWLLAAGWRHIGRGHPWRKAWWLLALGPLPVVLIPAAFYDAPVVTDVLLYPAARMAKSCDPAEPARWLGEPRWAAPRVIIAGGNEGPDILFRTPHSVIAGNFNVPGNRDVYDFFNAADAETPRLIAAKWHASLVLVCRHPQPVYAGFGGERKPAFSLRQGLDGSLRLGGDRAHPALMERLLNGSVPPWLKPIDLPPDAMGQTGYLLFEIKN